MKPVPNWCFTDYTIFGSEENVRKAHDVVQEALHTVYVENADRGWLGNLLCYFGEYKEYEDLTDRLKYGCRGFVQDVGDIVADGNESSFSIAVEDAWGPHEYPIENLCRKFGLQYVYCAEEPGCDVFVNTDISGKYYPQQYVLDDFNEYYEYFDTEKELLNFVKEAFGRNFDSFEEVSHWAYNGFTDDFPEAEGLSVHKFES
jgi:hypothetical protein